MPKYRLLYFNMRGRAEPIRWVLAVAKQDYEDDRFDKDKDWPTIKAETQYGKVPVLFVDSKPLSQSVAICRYLGRCHGLTVDDQWLAAEGDEVADAVHDSLPFAAKIIYAKLAGNIAEAQELAEEFNQGILKPTLKTLEEKLKNRTWFCGEKMTWVDIFASCYLSQISVQNDAAFSSFPLVKALIARVTGLPEIQQWLKERPSTTL